MTMEHCKNCRWWENSECTNRVKIGEPMSIDADISGLTDQLCYSYDEGGYFDTGPEFGCVHFAPKNPDFGVDKISISGKLK